MKNLHDRTLALAGVFQAAAMAHQIASHGTIADQDMETCVRSTAILDSPDTLSVFGTLANLQQGLQAINQQIGDHAKPRDTHVARYVIGMLQLERKLAKNESMLNTIRDRLQRVQQQIEHFGVTHENVIANLAGIYSDTISQLTPRIIISGEQTHLTNPKQTNRIRAVLLGGIRAAVLWRQVGGRRWHILLGRRKIVQEANRMLDNIRLQTS